MRSKRDSNLSGRPRPRWNRWLSTSALLISLMTAGMAVVHAAAQGIISGPGPLPSVIGKTHSEIQALWDQPRYIKVAPHDGDTRYAYFTLREWQHLAALSPATQGEDVYLAQDMGVQVHLRYQPVFSAEQRFDPEFRVGAVTYVMEEPTALRQVASLLPLEGFDLSQAQWFRYQADGRGRTLLVHWPSPEHPLARALTPFRADPGVTLFWEVGLAVPTDTVTADTPVNYVIERLEQFLYRPEDLQPIANPFE